MLLIFILICLVLFGWWHTVKPLPQGLNSSFTDIETPASQVSFLADLSYLSQSGEPQRQEQIFPTLFRLIDEAERYILLDMFLFNDQQRRQQPQRNLANKLVDHLIARKEQRPELIIDLITDPINSAYAALPAASLQRLQAAGIEVITTDLLPLRDSNSLYSPLWRLLLRWIPARGKVLAHPFDGSAEKVSLASWMSLLNFKANHRKVAVIDQRGNLVSLVSSANPHGGSSGHSNIAILIKDPQLAVQLHESEQAVARLSGQQLHLIPQAANTPNPAPEEGRLTLALRTEAAISDTLCQQLASTRNGDRVKMAMFYLGQRRIVKELIAATKRGVDISIILDPNKDAFGYSKNGVPNRPVAAELIKKTDGRIKVRWYQTHGEQFHSKLTLIERATGESRLLAGSANLTRRNVGNYNLESNLLIKGDSSSQLMIDVSAYFERLWSNQDGIYTADYQNFADTSPAKKIQYRLQEWTGLGTF